WPLEPIGANYAGEVAERWRYADGAGEIGVISSVTQAFCSTCTRMRLSTEGSLFTCLFAQSGHDLKALLRGGATDEAITNAIAGEHPLTLYLDKREIVTLMTLGHAPEALAIGYLRNQRLVDAVDDIAAVQVDWETQSVAVTTRKQKDLRDKMDKRTVTTGCGQGTMFGDLMEEIDQVKLRDDVRLTDAQLFDLIDKVRKHETIYKQA